MIASNRIWIVLLLVGLILSFVRADAQGESQVGAQNPYLKGTEGYYEGPRGLTSYQPVAIDQVDWRCAIAAGFCVCIACE